MGRNPIFQLPNHFPARDIVKPNLIKARYFRSGTNTPNDSFENNPNEIEQFYIEDVLEGKTHKKRNKSVTNSKASADFNPYNQAKPNTGKKKRKEELNTHSNDSRMMTKKSREQTVADDQDYQMQKQFYEKMLEADGVEEEEEKNADIKGHPENLINKNVGLQKNNKIVKEDNIKIENQMK